MSNENSEISKRRFGDSAISKQQLKYKAMRPFPINFLKMMYAFGLIADEHVFSTST